MIYLCCGLLCVCVCICMYVFYARLCVLIGWLVGWLVGGVDRIMSMIIWVSRFARIGPITKQTLAGNVVYRTISGNALPKPPLLCYAMLCYAMLCYAYAMLCSIPACYCILLVAVCCGWLLALICPSPTLHHRLTTSGTPSIPAISTSQCSVLSTTSP